MRPGTDETTCHTQSHCIDGLFWTAGETLVKIISNHGAAFIVGAPFISPSPSDNDSARETWGDLDLNLPPGRASLYTSVAFPARVTPDRRWMAHGRNDGVCCEHSVSLSALSPPTLSSTWFHLLFSLADGDHRGECEINRSCSLTNPMFFKPSGLLIFFLSP